MKAKLLIIFSLFLLCFVGKAGNTGRELITINTDDNIMVFSVESDRRVSFRYWGESFNGYEGLLDQKLKTHADIQEEIVSQIYPAYGGRCFVTPALKVTHTDGLLTTELIYDGKDVIEIDANRVETIIKMKDKIYDFRVNIHYLAYKTENIVEQWVTVSHNEKGTVLLENVASSFIPVHAGSYYLTHFNGTWAHEMQVEEERLTHGIKTIESKKGVRTSHSENPSFLLSVDGQLREDSGKVYGGHLAWSGNYRLSFELDETGRLGIISGMNPFASTIKLSAKETFSTPHMVLAYSSSGAGQVSRNLHDWSRKYALAHGDHERPIVLNSWEGAYFNFNEQTILDMIDKSADLGVEMFVLDDGWFGNKYPRNDDNAGLGDWQFNRQKLPNGIGKLAEYAVSKGMKFGIWIEPEMVNPNSELAQKHPEWIVKSGKRDILPMRNQWLLDLTNPKVQDFVVKTFDDVIALSPHITYIKWDANRHVDNVGSEYLPADKQSHFWYEYTAGLYSTYERIRAKHPDVMIQLCSSGGGRLDYGALKYHDEFWTSDNTNALDRVYIQYATSLFFPASAMSAHVSTSPNHQTGMRLPLKFRFDVAMSGRLGFEFILNDLKEDELDFSRRAVKLYKERIRPVVHEGDLYRLISPYEDGGWESHMYVSKDKSRAVFFAYSLEYHGRTTFFETCLKGLNPDAKYKVEEVNSGYWGSYHRSGSVYTGDYLMKVGVNLGLENPFDSCVLVLTEVE